MKKLILIIVSCFVCLCVHSQTFSKANNISQEYLPILNSDQNWRWRYNSSFSSVSYYQYWYSEDSFIIDTNLYYERIQSSNEDGSDAKVVGYFREAEGKLYQKLEGNFNEEMILDMTVKVGDSVNVTTYEGEKLTVTEVDTVIYNDGIPRKRIKIQCPEYPDLYSSLYWIEGIGRDFIGPHCSTDSGGRGLLCVLDDSGERIYSSIGEEFECWGTVNTEELDESPFTIYPNPFQNQLNIEIQDGVQLELQVTDLYGKVYVSEKINKSIIINSSAWNNGVYVVTLRSKGELIKQEKVVLTK